MKEVIKTEDKLYTEQEVEQKVQQANFEKMMHTYSVAINKMAKDTGTDKFKRARYQTDTDMVKMYLAQPDKWYKELVDLSLDLFISVPQYQNLIKYFSDMIFITPFIIPIKVNTNKKQLKQEYSDCGYLLEKMNIETEFRKIVTNVIRDGVFFGYEIETEDSYTIKHLNPKFCRVAGSDDGSWVFEFDFSFFNGKKTTDTKKLLLDSYPIEFKALYQNYQKDRANFRWQMLDLDKQVCIRYFPELNAPCIDFPPYCDLFEDLINIVDYKALNKLKTEMENYKFLALVMETNSKEGEMNKFTVDPALVSQYYDFLVQACGDAITPFISPVPIQELQFSNNNKDIDQVSNAEKAFWNASGVSDTLFGTGIKSGSGLQFSIQVDENRMSGIFNQIETFLTRKSKRRFDNIFKIKIPHITKFNRDEAIDRLLKTAQFGISSKMELLAVLGYSPAEVDGLLMLENDMLGLIDKLIPLQSSHTQTTDTKEQGIKKTKGRPAVNNDSNENSTIDANGNTNSNGDAMDTNKDY